MNHYIKILAFNIRARLHVTILYIAEVTILGPFSLICWVYVPQSLEIFPRTNFASLIRLMT